MNKSAIANKVKQSMTSVCMDCRQPAVHAAAGPGPRCGHHRAGVFGFTGVAVHRPANETGRGRLGPRQQGPDSGNGQAPARPRRGRRTGPGHHPRPRPRPRPRPQGHSPAGAGGWGDWRGQGEAHGGKELVICSGFQRKSKSGFSLSC